MKQFILLATVILSQSLAMAAGPRRVSLCGVPVHPYGCNEDVCIVVLKTSGRDTPIRTDSQSRISKDDLDAMADAGGVQCFSGYFMDKLFTIESFAD